MTDNEKRAHDLAVAVCLDIVHAKAKSQIAKGKEVVPVDYFSEYMNAYEIALEAFNEHFPNGK